MAGNVLRSKTSVSVVACVAALSMFRPPTFARAFLHATPSMSTASTYTPSRLERTGGLPAPFLTASASGSTIESALGSLGTTVRREMGDSPHLHKGRPRCGIAVLFYSGVGTPCDELGVQDVLAGFHECLPFVDQIIASPARASSASQHGNEIGRPQEGFTASVTLINNPDVKVDTFVLPPAPDRSFSSSLLRESDIRCNVVRALERSTASTEQSRSSYPTPSAPGQYETVCLAFGAELGAGTDPACNSAVENADINPCISQLHRLNSLLRESGSRVIGGASSPCPRANRCPLVASVTSAKGGVFVSRRDEETDQCSAVTGGIVGAILSGGCDSATSFQLVHAGKHAALRGSQFRIKRMEDGKIVEVMPVLSMTGLSSSVTPPADQVDDSPAWPLPRCDGAMSAAEWCKHAVVSSTRFEKMAMQSALGVGVLKRMGVDDQHLFDDGGSMSDNFPMGPDPAPVGVIPCLPAQSCFDIQEVELDGSLRVSRGAPAGELQVGDLCDFRAVGPLASMQAEQDAYAWSHASRISAAIHPAVGDPAQNDGAFRAPEVQGCFVAGAGARFVGGFEQEGCDDVVSAASGHGGCPAVGIVSDMQLVSVDNVMVTCSSHAGLAGVYVIGKEPE